MINREHQLKYLKKREKVKYMVVDFECENMSYKGRSVSQFHPDNYIVMAGWKVQGDARCHSWYVPTKQKKPLFIPEDVNLLVGHNIKFDLLWIWDTEEMRNFLKRGGRVWDTQTAEYLIRGMSPEVQMNSMDGIIESYGGRLKIDTVKELWEQGYKTSEIDPDMLKDYLIGTKEEEYNSGDIGNTEKIFKGQWSLAMKQCQIPMIEERMNALLAITEAEFNGLYIDQELGEKLLEENLNELAEYKDKLDAFIGELPEGCVFNWGSSNDVSTVLFGGTKPYKVRDYILDKDGNKTYAKKKVPEPVLDKDGNKVYYKSGKRQGELKTKLVDVDDHDRPKMKYFDKGYRFKRLITPLPEWQGSKVTQAGEPIYSVGADVIDTLSKTATVPFVKDYVKFVGLSKDITTYFKVVTKIKRLSDKLDEDGNQIWEFQSKKSGNVTMMIPDGWEIDTEKGMLTLCGEDSIIHHTINPNQTVTGRYSSKSPNMQNIPKGNKSKVKMLFKSRFDGGLMSEIDYSQLEVVVLGALSDDPQLVQDLIDKIDFHCKRVAMKYADEYPGGYEEILAIKKDEDHELHELTMLRRTACKILSFQKQYGAGAETIAKTVGLPKEEVEEMLRLEDEMYEGVVKFNEMIANHVEKFARRVWIPEYNVGKLRAQWQAPTGTIFTWDAQKAPEFMQKQGIHETFSPPTLKNYPIQGIGGEMVQSSIGRMFRALIDLGYWSGGDKPYALFVNTVHDCVWFDFKNRAIADEVIPVVMKHLENIPAVYKELYNMDIKVPFPVEAEIGESMYDLHHWEAVA